MIAAPHGCPGCSARQLTFSLARNSLRLGTQDCLIVGDVAFSVVNELGKSIFELSHYLFYESHRH